MSGAARRSLRRLVIGLAAALAVMLGAAPSVSAPHESEAAGTVRPGWAPGPDGTDIQHNETLVRDER